LEAKREVATTHADNNAYGSCQKFRKYARGVTRFESFYWRPKLISVEGLIWGPKCRALIRRRRSRGCEESNCGLEILKGGWRIDWISSLLLAR
jgi:hypothetical protein